MSSNSSESELIVACKRDEMWAKKALYEQYAPLMLSVCTRYCGCRETARDAMQDTFIKVFTKIKDFKAEGSFEGWLRKIAVTTSLEKLRQHREVPLDESFNETIETQDYSVFEKLSADDLHRMISELPQMYRLVFNLYAIEGYSYKEIAQIVNIKEITLRSYFFRAREILKEKVKLFII